MPDLGRSLLIVPLLYSFLLGVFAYWCSQQELPRLWFYLYSGVLLVAGIVHPAEFMIVSAIAAMVLLEVERAEQLFDPLKGQSCKSLELFLTVYF